MKLAKDIVIYLVKLELKDLVVRWLIGANNAWLGGKLLTMSVYSFCKCDWATDFIRWCMLIVAYAQTLEISGERAEWIRKKIKDGNKSDNLGLIKIIDMLFRKIDLC